MRFWRWGSARQTASGIGLFFFVFGLLMTFDVGGITDEEQSSMTGVVLAAIGASIILTSAWLARHRPDDTPWLPLDEDVHGGL